MALKPTTQLHTIPYERLLGNEYDALILLTNYQEEKNRTPFSLQILQIKYLTGTEIADTKLCRMAKAIREQYPDELFQKKIVRFLSYVNQSDWEANCILKMIDSVLIQHRSLRVALNSYERDFQKKNAEIAGRVSPYFLMILLKEFLAPR